MKKKKNKKKVRTIQVDYLARVEGEATLYIQLEDEKIREVKLKIFEPPRFFEAFLRGRNFAEAPDITARICGICPVAYQMSSVHAMENAFGVQVEGALRDLRRLIYCGEWIESHSLHIYMLHAPDFLGYPDAVRMAKDHPEIVKRGLGLKKVGNEIISLLGGREIHPINVKVGGFYRTPTRKELQVLLPSLEKAREAALETLHWAAQFDFPDFEQDYEFVALSHTEEYPFNEGRIISNRGLDISVEEFEDYFQEQQVEYSNALHCLLRGKPYFVGPMARFNLNFEKFSPVVQQAANSIGLLPGLKNPFKSILVRSLEVLHACEEALRIVQNYQEASSATIKISASAGKGYACTEAPRGLLYHRYHINSQELIEEAKIVPPTSQNQKIIEDDLFKLLEHSLHLEEEKLQEYCEHAVRNYDPCISCATHFLKLQVERK
ncbi:MAG: Ni/Fe hydrogenase subunit alpha [Deltaproteobacteria bacterium]|nr:Ni/Fe hydrogenase subunit alpha [Deltaproteobacteria bacterium]